ncbi:MAG: M14 family zinc carboxypeptidase [Planctomycetota bacterium]
MVRSRFGLAMALVALGGCVQFHPRNPPWHRAGAAGDTDAGAAAADAPARPEPALVWSVVGQSVQGRPLRATTIGFGPRRVLWIGGIHGDEREGAIATAELPAALAAEPGALDAVTLTILEDSNPDGTERNTRGNANGVDLNRNFPAINFKPHRMFGITPLSQPEARAVHDLIRQLQPDLVIVAHSWRNDRFINFDGPGRELAERFSRLSGYPMRQSTDIAPTPGSLGSWVGNTLGLPILTLEYYRGRDPWSAWQETRLAILAVVVGDRELVSAPTVTARAPEPR